MFKQPTLVTLTAPTCAGKNYLLEEMVKAGFGRIVSTTDRPKRTGELEGVHYYFISTERSKEIEAADEFAELITYNGTRYGVTHAEMNLKMADSRSLPPIVILEPQGIRAYHAYCHERGYDMFSVFIDAPEQVRLDRLTERTTNDIMRTLWNANVNQGNLAGERKHVHKLININNKRLQAIIEEERSWIDTNAWDVYASGVDAKLALEQIAEAVKIRNEA